jgi:hypothetical protein
MNPTTEQTGVQDYVPEPRAEAPIVTRLGWPDAAMIGGSIVAVVMMLVTAAGETQPWHFLIIGAGLLAFVVGAIRARVWE